MNAVLIFSGMGVFLLMWIAISAWNVSRRMDEFLVDDDDDDNDHIRAAADESVRLTKEECFRILEFYDGFMRTDSTSNWIDHHIDDFDKLVTASIWALTGCAVNSNLVIYPDTTPKDAKEVDHV